MSEKINSEAVRLCRPSIKMHNSSSKFSIYSACAFQIDPRVQIIQTFKFTPNLSLNILIINFVNNSKEKCVRRFGRILACFIIQIEPSSGTRIRIFKITFSDFWQSTSGLKHVWFPTSFLLKFKIYNAKSLKTSVLTAIPTFLG